MRWHQNLFIWTLCALQLLYWRVFVVFHSFVEFANGHWPSHLLASINVINRNCTIYKVTPFISLHEVYIFLLRFSRLLAHSIRFHLVNIAFLISLVLTWGREKKIQFCIDKDAYQRPNDYYQSFISWLLRRARAYRICLIENFTLQTHTSWNAFTSSRENVQSRAF